MIRAVAPADAIGIRALLAHAIDDNARAFYLHHDSNPPPPTRHLMILIKGIQAAVNTAPGS